MNTTNQRKKKLDFFNGGRGVDLSMYEEEAEDEKGLSDEQEELSMEDPVAMRSLPGEEEVSTHSPAADGFSETQWPQLQNKDPQQSFSPHVSPSYTSQPPHYIHAPVPHYFPPTFNALEPHETSHGPIPMGFNPHLPNPTHAPLPYQRPPVPPHITPGNFHTTPYPSQPPMFPEPNYSGFLNSPGYSPLRPMDTNGLNGVNIGCNDPLYSMDHSSGVSGGRDTDGRRKKRQQKCSLCSNHGIQVDVKGHKWFCSFRNCDCERCTITRGRQHHMKEQQKLTRHLQRLQ